MLQFRTQGFNGTGVKYSPFFDSRIAVSTAANFGLVGNGRLYILGLTEKGIVPEKWFETQDALYDTAWSELHEHQILVASGDGSIKLYDIAVDSFPIQSWAEHAREVFCVHWNLVRKDIFLSSSWDGAIKIWDPQRAQSVQTLPTHSCTYSAQFSPHSPSLLSAVSSDSKLRVFDLRTPANVNNHLTSMTDIHQVPVAGVPRAQLVPPAEALTHDWNKYRESIIATSGVDRLIRTWDLRMLAKGPIAVLPGHDYAVRKISWSPHLSDILLSASYDMTCRVWTDGSTMGHGKDSTMDVQYMAYGDGKELGRMDRHTEFCTGVDWCLFGAEGWCATCAWDEGVLVWDVRAIMKP